MQVSLDANGWHRKLQVWTFGNDIPLFENLCPYFWLTIACVLGSPFIKIFRSFSNVGKGVVKGIYFGSGILLELSGALWMGLSALLEKPRTRLERVAYRVSDTVLRPAAQATRRAAERKVLHPYKSHKYAKEVINLPDGIIFKYLNTLFNALPGYIYCDRVVEPCTWFYDQKAWDSLEHCRSSWTGPGDREKAIALDRLNTWRLITPDWEDRFTEVQRTVNERNRQTMKNSLLRKRQADEAKARREAWIAQRKKYLLNIANATQRFVPLVAKGLAAATVTISAYMLAPVVWDAGVWIVGHPYDFFVAGATLVGGIAGLVLGLLATGLAGFYGFKFLSSRIREYREYNSSLPPISKLKTVVAVKDGVASASKSVVSALGLFVAFAMAVKQNHCPAIKWKH